MPGKDCPNYISCQLIKKEGFLQDKSLQRQYIRDFCQGEHEAWVRCKRYIAKQELNFCPDFVLPDSPWSMDEILDIFEEREMDDPSE